MVGWGAVVFAIQSWLDETPAQLAGGKQPAYFSVGMAFMSLLIVSFFSPLWENGGECANIRVDVYADLLPRAAEDGCYRYWTGGACSTADVMGGMLDVGC